MEMRMNILASRPSVRAGLALVVLLGLPARGMAQSKLHTFYARVTDEAGAPVTTLGPTDFGLIEAGAARKVVGVKLGGTTSRIVFLVDSSDAISKVINPWRAGMQAFLDNVPAQDEITLVTMGRQLRIRVQPTMDRKKLKDEAGRVFSDGGGTVLLDALDEANSRLLMKAEDRSPVIVILTTDGSETSTSVREEGFNKLLAQLMARGAVVHAVVLGNGGTGTTGIIGAESGSAGLQGVIALNLTGNTGGHLDSVNGATALADKMKGVAQLLAAQHEAMKTWYQVDYTTDTVGPARGLDVTVSNGGKVELSQSPPKQR
jgi:hypothetical protein